MSRCRKEDGMTHGLVGGIIRGRDWQTGDRREQEQGRLGGENGDKEQVVLQSLFDLTVKETDGWD